MRPRPTICRTSWVNICRKTIQVCEVNRGRDRWKMNCMELCGGVHTDGDRYSDKCQWVSNPFVGLGLCLCQCERATITARKPCLSFCRGRDVYPNMHLGSGCVVKGGCDVMRGEGVVKGVCERSHTPFSPNTTSDGHRSGRYASYWNAFLFWSPFRRIVNVTVSRTI